jgi:acyl-coenzyme A thioesterase PaaI-like protein
MTGEARVTQLGKTIAFVEGKLMAEDGTVLATGSTSIRLVDSAKALR